MTIEHPDGRELTERERYLWRLKMVSHEMLMLHCSALKSQERKADADLIFTLTNYGLILLCKFLEIWDEFNGLGKVDEDVRAITQAVAPAIRRITKTWPNIRSYRNWAIAHPYSVRESEEITPPWKLLEERIAPNRNAEVILLMECARFAAAGVLAHFGVEYRALKPTFEVPEVLLPSGGGVDTGEDAETERRIIAGDLDERLARLGVNMRDPVFREMVC